MDQPGGKIVSINKNLENRACPGVLHDMVLLLGHIDEQISTYFKNEDKKLKIDKDSNDQ